MILSLQDQLLYQSDHCLCYGWNQFMNLDISPVVDDETGREIGRNLPAEEEVKG